jgi:phosphonate transport system substrate-binding protein
MRGIVIAGCVILALVTGCKKPEKTSPAEKPQGDPLVIGLIPEQDIFSQVERYRPLADYLSRKIGRTIELKMLTRYGNIVNNFVSSGMDGAFFGSFTYTLAHAKVGVEVLARPVNLDGASTYHGLLFVRKDSGIISMKDMKGKRFVFVDKATTAGYLLPLEYFHRNGVKNYRAYLGEAYFAGTHEDAIHDVLEKKADIGAAKNTVFERLARNDPRINKELLVLVKSPEVPENGLAMRRDLDEALKQDIKAALLTMDKETEGQSVLRTFGAQRFIETTNKDYAPVIEYAREIGLNLSTYDYLND